MVAIAGLIGGGYGDKIVLSQNILGHNVVVPGLPLPEEPREITYLDDEFIPRLLHSEIAQQSIQRILIDNPRRIFEA